MESRVCTQQAGVLGSTHVKHKLLVSLESQICNDVLLGLTGEEMFCYCRHVKGRVMKEYESDPTENGA